MAGARKKVALTELEFLYSEKDAKGQVVLFINGDEVRDTPTSIRLLSILHGRTGSLFKRDYLIEQLKIGGVHKAQTLNEYVYRLRKLLRKFNVAGEIAGADEVGYVLCAFAE